jgi:hypothetical protein
MKANGKTSYLIHLKIWKLSILLEKSNDNKTIIEKLN